MSDFNNVWDCIFSSNVVGNNSNIVESVSKIEDADTVAIFYKNDQDTRRVLDSLLKREDLNFKVILKKSPLFVGIPKCYMLNERVRDLDCITFANALNSPEIQSDIFHIDYTFIHNTIPSIDHELMSAIDLVQMLLSQWDTENQNLKVLLDFKCADKSTGKLLLRIGFVSVSIFVCADVQCNTFIESTRVFTRSHGSFTLSLNDKECTYDKRFQSAWSVFIKDVDEGNTFYQRRYKNVIC